MSIWSKVKDWFLDPNGIQRDLDALLEESDAMMKDLEDLKADVFRVGNDYYSSPEYKAFIAAGNRERQIKELALSILTHRDLTIPVALTLAESIVDHMAKRPMPVPPPMPSKPGDVK